MRASYHSPAEVFDAAHRNPMRNEVRYFQVMAKAYGCCQRMDTGKASSASVDVAGKFTNLQLSNPALVRMVAALMVNHDKSDRIARRSLMEITRNLRAIGKE